MRAHPPQTVVAAHAHVNRDKKGCTNAAIRVHNHQVIQMSQAAWTPTFLHPLLVVNGVDRTEQTKLYLIHIYKKKELKSRGKSVDKWYKRDISLTFFFLSQSEFVASVAISS